MTLLRPSPNLWKGSGEVLPPLPAYIKLPQGRISHAWRCDNPHKVQAPRRSGAKRAGLLYQSKVEAWLRDSVASGNSCFVDCGPWFCYSDESGRRRYCQPDALVRAPSAGSVGIVEVKIRWTSDAWWQLRKLYEPVLRVAKPAYEIFALCICRSYDPAISIPERVNLCDTFAEVLPGCFNVMVWKPQ